MIFLALLLCFNAEAANAEPVSRADAEWQAVIGVDVKPERRAGETSLAYFMRGIELTDLRRREMGLEFWDRYPEDLRRYQWLMMTVAMPPHYPRDLNEWAVKESSIEPNTAAVDQKKITPWNERYAVLRTQFLAASEVTEQERQYLRCGELQEQLLRFQEAGARSETVDVGPFVAGLKEYLQIGRKLYPAGSSSDNPDGDDTGYQEFSSCSSQTVGQLFQVALDLGIDGLKILDYAYTLSAELNTASRFLLQAFAQRLSAEVQLRDQDPWQRLFDWNYLNYSRWNAFRNSPVGKMVAQRWFIVRERKFRERGLILWGSSPDSKQRMRWLYDTQNDPSKTLYPENITAGIQALAEDRLAQVEIDTEAAAEWKQRYAELQAALWSDPQTTDLMRAQFLATGLPERIGEAIRLCKRSGDTSLSFEILNTVHELYTKYESRHDGGGWTLKSAWEIVRWAPDLGLTPQELKAFFTPMLAYGNADLQDYAAARLLVYDLRTSPNKISIKAPVLADGRMFDLAELRGKIVLIDFWNTGCVSCISSMPHIKSVYDRYREKGFEVLSVCVDGQQERKKVARVEKELGLTWTVLAADWNTLAGDDKSLRARYGWDGTVPQYMLLDREGRLVADTAEVNMGRNLEPLLKKLLADESVAGN